MRLFAITAISSFAILSATALCAAHLAMNLETASSATLHIELVAGKGK